MFTGLIAEQGTIQAIHRRQQMIQVVIKASQHILTDYRIGDSMAVNGVCLTAIEVQQTRFTAEIMPETFKRTTFATAQIGQAVNLERAMLGTQRFEGHLVSGHIDTVARLIKKQENQNALVLTFTYPTRHAGEIIAQGSVAVNGVSLTVTAVTAATFSISLIPHSKSATNLGTLSVGACVNIETDMVGKYLKALGSKLNIKEMVLND